MRLFKNIFRATLLMGVLLLSATLAQARTDEKYKVNKIWENVFVNAGGGASMLTEDNQGFFNGKVKGNYDITVGKWFAPWFGFRVGYQGGVLSEYVKEPRHRLTTPVLYKGMNVYESSIRYGHTHADFLWNFTNSVAGYDRTRLFDFIPYIHLGVFHSYDMEGKTFKREFAPGLGIINSFRIHDAFRVFLDLRATFVNGRNLKRPYSGGGLMSTANIGLTYNIGKSWWETEVGAKNDINSVHNPFFDNMFISAMGGPSVMLEGNQFKGGNGRATASFDISLGKWFSPYFGGRIGYQGGRLAEWVNQSRPGMSNIEANYPDQVRYLNQMDYSYVHADIMWDVLNTFTSNTNRAAGLALYGHMGYFNNRPTDVKQDQNGLGGGLGLYTNIRLTPKLDLVFDARAMVVKGESVGQDRGAAFAGTIFGGLAYNLGNKTFPQSRVFAEESAQKPQTGPAPYVVGKMKDNWFLTLGAGGTLLFEPGSDLGVAGVTPSLELTIGKWISPWTAVRFGYQGYNMKTRSYERRGGISSELTTNKHGKTYYVNSFNYGYFHADFLWDATNTFSYDRNRIWSLVPYTHMGVMRSFIPESNSYKREYVLGAGLINSFQVGSHASLFVDLRATFVNNHITRRTGPGSSIAANAMAGVEFDLSKINFWKSYNDPSAEQKPVFGRWHDNIFVSAGAGLNLIYEDGFSLGPNFIPAFTYEVSLGKWFSPDVAVRLGYQGGSLKQWLDEQRPLLTTQKGIIHGQEKYKFDAHTDYFHADILWDATNLFSPSGYGRWWSLIPYYHTGFYNVNTATNDRYSSGYAAGFGLINDFLLAKSLSLYVDLRATVLNGRDLGRGRGFGYGGSAFAGLTYHIGGAQKWVSAARFKNKGYGDNMDKPLPTGPAPLLDNKIFDNIFVSLGAGVNMLSEDHISRAGFTPVFDLNVGKWITPSFGLRLGIQGADMTEFVREARGQLTPTTVERRGETQYKVEMKYHYTHLDFLWNINDTFTPYDANRFWNIIPYSQFGVLHSYYKNGITYKREYAIGAGLLNTFRLSKNMKAFLDLKATFMRARSPKIAPEYSHSALATSALVGISYDIGKNWWDSYETASNRYAYVLNDFKDNFFISVAGGATLLTEGNMNVGFNGGGSWTFDVALGKWFSPQFGARLGYQRGVLAEWVDNPRPDMGTVADIFRGESMYAIKFPFGYLHADFLWDALSSIIGYDEYRFYRPIPYVHSGFFSSYTEETKNEWAAGIGLLNNFTISPHFSLYADLRATVLKSNSVGKAVGSSFAGSLLAGISYNLSKSSFSTSKRIAIVKATGLDKKKEKTERAVAPYISNGIFDNLFVSIGGGVNILGEGKCETEPGARFGFDVNIGKWYNPYFGNRIGVTGSELHCKTRDPRYRLTEERDELGYYSYNSQFVYAHADFLWNATNTFSGYQRDRVWDCVPYTHFGVAQGFYTDGATYKREYAYGAGLLNTFKLFDRASLFADIRLTTMSGRFLKNANNLPVLTSIFAGLSYDVGAKNYWRSYTEASKEEQLIDKGYKKGYFFTLGGGLSLAAEGGQRFGSNACLTTNMEFGFGKWFSPHFGGRIAFQGGVLSQVYDTPRLGITTTEVTRKGVKAYKSREMTAHFHADLLWNLSNTFFGVNRERVVEFIPYAHTGFIRADRITGEKLSNGLASGLGLLTNFRLDDEFGLYFDGRTYCYKSNTFGKSKGFAFGTTANIGMTYNFGGDNWKKAVDYDPKESQKKERFEKDYRSFAISTNLLSWLSFGTINVGAQYEISRHFTLEGKVKYNPWTFNRGVNGQFQDNQQSFAMGARYWPWYSFAGWWIGADAQFQNYRRGGLPWYKTCEEGTGYGIGLSFGYSVLVTKWLNLDFGIGGWGGYKTFTNYENSQFKASTGNGAKWFLAPNELSVSAVFIF